MFPGTELFVILWFTSQLYVVHGSCANSGCGTGEAYFKPKNVSQSYRLCAKTYMTRNVPSVVI